jgi:hypothetical protein
LSTTGRKDSSSIPITLGRARCEQLTALRLAKSGQTQAKRELCETLRSVCRDWSLRIAIWSLVELKSLEPAVGHQVDGIIGSRLFDDFVVVVDYERHCMSVYAPNRYRPSGRETAFSVRIDQHGFQYVDATIALPGAMPVSGSFLIDGGANYYANLYKPFSDAPQIPPSTMKLLYEPGTPQPRDGRAERIVVGSYSVKNPPITFAQDVEGLMASKDYAGLIGAEFLERFTVVFDSPGQRILLTPNRSYGDPAEYDQSGLRIRADGPKYHRFVVTRIVPQSAAVGAGIEAGDVIESIDNLTAQDLTLTEIRSMLRRPMGRYTIGIVRGSKPLRISIRLLPLYNDLLSRRLSRRHSDSSHKTISLGANP